MRRIIMETQLYIMVMNIYFSITTCVISPVDALWLLLLFIFTACTYGRSIVIDFLLNKKEEILINERNNDGETGLIICNFYPQFI